MLKRREKILKRIYVLVELIEKNTVIVRKD